MSGLLDTRDPTASRVLTLVGETGTGAIMHSISRTAPCLAGRGQGDHRIYSGTAAVDLRELSSAPALGTIARLNELMARQTHVDSVLLISHAWPQRQAERWLAPIGCPSPILDEDGSTAFSRLVLTASGALSATRTLGEDASDQMVGVSAYVWPETHEAVGAVIEHESPSYDAFKDLVRWLQATDAEVAEMVGVGRTTPYGWKRDGREPRRDTVRRLFAAHAVVGALARRLGDDGVWRWIVVDDPSRRERILAGDIASVQDEARNILFARRRRRVRPGAWMPEDEPDE
jgi:hypothetical protein